MFCWNSCFFHDPGDVANLTSGSSAFSKTSLNIRKFMVHVLLKPGLENFEHYFNSMWDERNCAVVWAFLIHIFMSFYHSGSSYFQEILYSDPHSQRLWNSQWSRNRCFSGTLSLFWWSMLVIWSLVPLSFLNPAWTSGSSWFMYYWSLAWRILSITLLACEISENVW